MSYVSDSVYDEWFTEARKVLGLREDGVVVVRLKKEGMHRVLSAAEGMTFIVDKFTPKVDMPGSFIAHVRDYRYNGGYNPFQIWSIGPDGYEVIYG